MTTSAEDKILKLIETLVEGQEILTKEVQDVRNTQAQTNKRLESIDKRLDGQGSDISTITTAIDALATKGDLETAVETAKEEIQANILDQGAKITRTLHNHETRIKNLEKHTETSDPTKN